MSNATVSVIEMPPYRTTKYGNNLSYEARRVGSYIEVWKSLGGPDPFDLSVPNAIEAAKDYVLRGGTPAGAFDFQWWSKRPPGDQEWRGGPGSIDPPNGTLLIESSYVGGLPFVGQSGTHSRNYGFLENAEIKYGIDTAVHTFPLGQYFYIEPNSTYGMNNYWEDYWNGSGWNPGQPTPPDHYERQKPATIPAKLLRARLNIGSATSAAPIINVYLGDQLTGKYQNNYYSDLVTASPIYSGDITNVSINIPNSFIFNNMDSLGNIKLSFIDSDTMNGNFTCVPGSPIGNSSLTVNNQAQPNASFELTFMSPTYNHFVYTVVAPPLRLTQRDDNLGLSPTARVLYTSQSRQNNNSARIDGGLYL